MYSTNPLPEKLCPMLTNSLDTLGNVDWTAVTIGGINAKAAHIRNRGRISPDRSNTSAPTILSVFFKQWEEKPGEALTLASFKECPCSIHESLPFLFKWKGQKNTWETKRSLKKKKKSF